MGLSQTRMYSHTSLGTTTYGVAPLLTWTTGTTDPTPDFQVDYLDVLVGDVVTFQFSQSATFSSGITTVTNTLDSSEVLAATLTETLSSPLADGAWYARAKVTRSGLNSPWSNTETKTLDSPPVMTSATTGTCNDGVQLAFALTASQSSTFAITGGADAAQFSISGSTLRWVANGTQNFAAPADVGTNNVYDVQVTPTAVADSEAGSAQSIAITVVFVVVDADAQTYINALIAAGTTPNATKQGAIDAFFLGCKSDGIYTSISDMVLPVWASAAANVIKVKGGISATFPAGTVTHNTGNITFSSNGYMNTKLTATPYSDANGALQFICLPSTNAAQPGSKYDFGSRQNNAIWEMSVNATSGSFSNNGNGSSVCSGVGNGTGIYIANRENSFGAELTRYNGSNTTIGTDAGVTSVTASAADQYLGCRRDFGSANDFTNLSYSCAGNGVGLTTANRALLQSRLWTLLTALGGT